MENERQNDRPPEDRAQRFDYICTGRVQPERANVSFSRIQLKNDEVTVVASCDASQITVCLADRTLDGYIAAHIRAEDVAHIVVGALGFALGCGYWTEIVQVTEADGTPQVFGVQPTNADGDLGFENHHPIFNRAIGLSARDVFFRLAVRDYLAALPEATDCATYCYRAIEAIKAAFVFSTGNDRWDDMHEALGTDRDEITDTIKQYADPVRHGNWVNMKVTTKTERWRMLALTRNILMRYLDHAQPA